MRPVVFLGLFLAAAAALPAPDARAAGLLDAVFGSEAPVAAIDLPLPQRKPGPPHNLPRPLTAKELALMAPAAGSADVAAGEALSGQDADESAPLPPYPPGGRVAIGAAKIYTVGEEDTFVDIARYFGLGYVELRAANPGVDPWTPLPGQRITIPAQKLLPRAPQDGIVVNLGEMRMYYYRAAGKPPLTYPLGIGREGLETPTGETIVMRKTEGPSWNPTPRMRKDKPWLPASIPPGPANPLGTHALYLGWPTFLIHGSNKPWGIGRRVSSGCLRMYPEDIIEVFNSTPPGMKVTVVNQPVLVGWLEDGLYLEANPSMTQSSEIEVDRLRTVKPLTPALRQVIAEAAGISPSLIDWAAADKAVRERRGVPVRIARPAQGLSMSGQKSAYN
jgi:L,D-transpeptidase ErfK/SrfK